MKEKIIVFGTGSYYERVKKEVNSKYEVIGFLDNFKGGYYEGKKIYSIKDIKETFVEKVLICSMYFIEIGLQLLKEGINTKRIDLGLEFNIVGEELQNINAKIEIDNTKNIVFVFESIKINIKNLEDFYIIEETYLEDNYNYTFNKKKDYTVIDVGANIGDSTLYFANNKNVKRVLAFEPFDKTFSKAKENISKSEGLSSKISIFKYGLGNDEKKIEISYDELNSTCMSTVYENEKGINKEITNIQIRDFSTVYKEMIENESVFLKIDCEGAEFEIFESIKKDISILKNVEAIILEWHYKFPKIILDTLNEAGFKCFMNRNKKNVGLIYAFNMKLI